MDNITGIKRSSVTVIGNQSSEKRETKKTKKDEKISAVSSNSLPVQNTPTGFPPLFIFSMIPPKLILHISNFLPFSALENMENVRLRSSELRKSTPHLLLQQAYNLGFETPTEKDQKTDDITLSAKETEEEIKSKINEEKFKKLMERFDQRKNPKWAETSKPLHLQAKTFIAAFRKECEMLFKEFENPVKKEVNLNDIQEGTTIDPTPQVNPLKNYLVYEGDSIEWKTSIYNLKKICSEDLFNLFKSDAIYKCPKVLAFLLKHQNQFHIEPCANFNLGKEALTTALSHVNPRVCALLLKHKAECNTTTPEGFHVLHLAVATGDVNLLNTAREIAEIEYDCLFDSTIEPINFLIRKLIDPTASWLRRYNLITPLALACITGNVHFFDKLCKKQNLKTVCSNNKVPLLHFAVQGGSIEIAEKLLLYVAVDQLDDCTDKITPLCIAAIMKQTGMIAFLLEKGANKNSRTTANSKPLHFAACSGSLETFLLLFDPEKDDINEKGANGCTPLLLAAREGNFNLVGNLISMGADPWIANNGLALPLHYAAAYNRKKYIEKWLEETSEAVNSLALIHSSFYWLSPLHLVSEINEINEQERLECVNCLLDHGANPYLLPRLTNPQLQPHITSTPLYKFLVSGYTEITKKIFQKPPPPALLPPFEHFLYAALLNSKNVTIIEAIKNQGANLNSYFPYYSSLGSVLTDKNMKKEDKLILIKELIRLGANPYHPKLDANDNTTYHYQPFYLALTQKNTDILAAFLEGCPHQEDALLIKEVFNSDCECLNVFLKTNNNNPLIYYYLFNYIAEHINDSGVFRVLKENNIGINALNPHPNTPGHGKTPLIYAVSDLGNRALRENYVSNLLNAGADPLISDRLGQTVLHYAAQQGDVKVVKILLEKCPQLIHRPGKNEKTALEQLQMSGKATKVNQKMIKLLQEY